MRAFVDAVGLLGTGLAGWQQSVPILSGRTPYRRADIAIPSPTLLPPAERRRTGPCVKLAIAVAQEALGNAGRSAADVPTVFSSSSAEAEVIHQICEALVRPEREVSPTQFHNSVHNAPSGYWSIGAHSNEPSTSLCCYDASFAAGLLETMAQVAADGKSVLLVAYEVPYPEPLKAVRPMGDMFGVALLLSPHRSAASLGRIEMDFEAEPKAPTAIDDEALEALRSSVPAARSLPLLVALAAQKPGSFVLEYVATPALCVSVAPCG